MARIWRQHAGTSGVTPRRLSPSLPGGALRSTDRSTEAIGQFGSDKLDVRIGAAYALGWGARDSPRDHPTVTEVLAA